ncbi:MAG: glycosyl hydrolase family protein [Cellulosilyticum sp.]|nr:glycosyl hydrolase family protein [Cellulosilyticum sp.]
MLDFIDGSQYELILYDDFLINELQLNYWLPVYLPQWSSRKKTRPSYCIENSILTLFIKDSQEPWCPEWNGQVRVSNLQTGVFSGEVGSVQGQHHFIEGLIVREKQEKEIKVALRYGYVECRARCNLSEENVAALWLIGVEEERKQSAEICLFEIKGWNVKESKAVIGYGLHPFGDYEIKEEFIEEEMFIDVTMWNTYALDWSENEILFFINGKMVRKIKQSPNYPMQLMLNLYDLENKKNEENTLEVDYVEVYQRKS